MQVIYAKHVDDALQQGVRLLKERGVILESRVGKTLEVPFPVSTVYTNPINRVIQNKDRDANPFFHIMESLWILAGRQDVKFLTEFNKRMSEFSDNGVSYNAPYGYRMRGGKPQDDQVQQVIDILKSDPLSRQAVIQIWNKSDLNHMTKDKACNLIVVFRIRNNMLDMIVYNRSNDMLWGAYGANVVQFSMLQEYVSASIGIDMGTYTQVSNSYHVYLDGPGGALWDKLTDTNNGTSYYRALVGGKSENIYDQPSINLVRMKRSDMSTFNYDLRTFFKIYDKHGLPFIGDKVDWESIYFEELILPMLSVYLVYKKHKAEIALKFLHRIKGDDWRTACETWLTNRIKK